METIKIIITTQFSGLTIAELLQTWLVPRKERYLLNVEKRLLLNGEFQHFSNQILAGDEISINFFEPESNLVLGNSEFVDVLYEDSNVIVVNKAAGMKTHANEPGEIALQNHVAAYCGRAVYVVHRLDRETSGVVLFAKNSFVLPILSEFLAERKIHREYLALVQGNINLDRKEFTINKKIGRDRHKRQKRCISSNGQEAITHIQLIKNLAKSALVKCQLETGRTHQIRVHLADAEHPIVADPLYNPVKSDDRMMLHASKMLLTIPFTFENVEILAESKSFKEQLNRTK